MTLQSLELENYRNYAKLSLPFSPEINILYGDNAQGKTNILEAIYFCAVSHSHRGSKDRDCIRFGEDEAHIKCFAVKGNFTDRIDIHLKKNHNKGIAVNGIPLKRASDLFGHVNVVFFSPEDLSIIKKGPSDRRRFMDLELCQTDAFYTASLTAYNRAVMQKNQLLKEIAFQPYLRDTLDTWNEQLVRYGTDIIRRRKEFILECAPLMREIHASLTSGKEEMLLSYEPDVEEGAFADRLRENAEREIRLKMSMVGPHRDDLKFSADGMDIRTFGSQGQQRTTALSLKLSEIEWVRRRRKDSPILLLDDVLSELDRSRQEQLLERIKGTQTILTCTGVDDFVSSRLTVNRTIHVKNGEIEI
ncbi:MAG: DNA replication/repair protein RecF [Lachnospiraceae bacterium]|nr:DNA replication/repair protein RecF [Lachnospiraceae bacterium]